MVWSQRRAPRINALLKSIYTDLRHPASFSSPCTLFRVAKQKNSNILFKGIESWLETQPVYTTYPKTESNTPIHTGGGLITSHFWLEIPLKLQHQTIQIKTLVCDLECPYDLILG